MMGVPLDKGINCVPLDDSGNGMYIFGDKDHHSARVTDNFDRLEKSALLNLIALKWPYLA